ncbi:MAG: ABC transporter substrate-binding protein [Patescibacteria group bacterium]
MRKARFLVHLVLLFLKRFGILIGVGILVGGILFGLRSKITTLLPGLTTQEKIGVVGRFTADTLPLSISSRISFGLTIVDKENLPQPGIAESWETKNEGRVWVFTFKKDLRWQDNTSLKSSDFSYNFPGITVSYPDEAHIEFQLSDPYAPFPIIVSRPYFKKGLLGVGEWRVRKIVTSAGNVQELTLEEKTTRIQKVYRFYPTEESLIAAFKLGEVNTISEISDPHALFSWKTVELSPISHEDRFVGIFLNTADSLLAEKNIRQALAYATNKGNIDEMSTRALSPLSPSSWAYNPLVKTYDYDPARARKLLDELPKDQREQFSINLVTIPSLLEPAEKIAKDWEEVGVSTTVQVGTGVPENFQALLATQVIPPDPDQYSMWHSTQTDTNITHYKSARIDKLLEDGRRTLNQDERKRIYLDFQRFLVEDSPVIFLYHPISYTISQK